MVKFYLPSPISAIHNRWKSILFLFFFPFFLYAQPTSLTFNTSGTWTVPNGYYANINVQVWGAGGGGGYSAGGGNGGGGGGGGGAYAFRIFTSVPPGTSFAVTVGTGGAAGTSGTAARDGGFSSFVASGFATTSAAGGDSARTQTGGTTTGLGTTSGIITRTGGSGGNGTVNGGGGGGGGSPISSTTSVSNGGNGSNGGSSSGGNGGTGQGTGGNGGDEDGSPDAIAGTAPGGGGGGKGEDGGTSKSGANGRVIVTVTFFWTTSQTMEVIGGGGDDAPIGCSSLTGSGVVTTSVIVVPAGNQLTWKLGANTGEPVCGTESIGGTAPFEAVEGVGLFSASTMGGTQVYDSRIFTGAGNSDEPPNLPPAGSGCIYNNNATTRYLTFKTINTTNNTASVPSQDEEVAYVAYQVISGNAGCSTNLPIQLSDFEVSLNKGLPYLEWSTLSEFNNDYFSVERSRNGKDFSEITKVKGIGTSDKQNDYIFTDLTAFKGINYYRIKQVDLDGRPNIHTTRSIMVPIDEISIYPTIFENEITLQLPPPYETQVKWLLYDALGKVIRTGQIPNSQSVQKLPMTGLQSGSLYILAVQTKNGIETKKLVRF